MKLNKKKLAAAIALISTGGHAWAQEPELLVRVAVEHISGAEYQASVYYQPSDEEGVTGIGTRLHYDSSVLSLGDVTIETSQNLLGQQNSIDTDNFDNNLDTDNYFNTSWAVFSGSNWPSETVEEEVLLYSVNFELESVSDPSNVIFNITASSTPAGYNLSATNYAARLPDIYVAPEGQDNAFALNEDDKYTFSEADFGFSDPNDTPSNSFEAVKITSLPDLGSLRLSGSNVAVGQEVAVASLSSLVYTPDPDQNGQPFSSFQFQVKDDGSSKTGSIVLDQSPNTITFNVAAVNDAPAGSDNTVSLLEESTHTFGTVDFGFTDPMDTPANSFSAVKIISLPATGELKLNGAEVVAGQEIDSVSLAQLVYHPPENTSGASLSSFKFRVMDDGGTANSGQDTDLAERTMTIDVTGINDMPSAADKSISILEGSTHTFVAADFGFSDANDSPSNSLETVILESVPAVGTLRLSGTSVSAGDEIAANQLSSLVYTPSVAPGVNVSSLTFRVRDNGGVANGGNNESVAANTLSFSVSDINSAPVGSNNVVTVDENDTFSFQSSMFGFTDPEDTPANNLSAIIIASLPASGQLALNGSTVSAGQSISAADISSLTYTPTEHQNGDGYSSFNFKVQDDGGTEDGGVDTDPTVKTITIDVTSANSQPSAVDNSIALYEDIPQTLNIADFSFSDSNDTPANSLAAIKITSLPVEGVLSLNDTAVTIDQIVNAAEISNLLYTPLLNASGQISFTFDVQDDGGDTNGGMSWSANSATLTLDVQPISDAPTGADNDITINENTAHTFTATDFVFSDANDDPADSLVAVIIETVPGSGRLELNGNEVTAGNEVPVAELGNLVYTPEPHAFGPAYGDFEFKVKDSGRNEHAEDAVISVNSNTLQINVNTANSAPVGADTTQTLLENGSFTFSADLFGFDDPNDTPANQLSGVRISNLPANGALKINDVAVSADQVVTVTELANMTYEPEEHGNGAAYDSFNFQVKDSGGTANGGVEFDETERTFTFDVTAINSEPSGANRTVTSPVDGSYTFSVSDFGFTDNNDDPANALKDITVVTVPGVDKGTLRLNDVDVTAGQVIAAADIAGLVFTPPEGVDEQPYTSFTFQVSDDGGTDDGGEDTDQTPDTISINVGNPPPPPSNDDDDEVDEEVTDAADEIDSELDDIVVDPSQPVDDEVVDRVNNASNKANDLAESVANSDLPEGEAGVETALTALDSLSKTLSVSGDVSQVGGAVANESTLRSLNNVANVMNKISERGADVTPEQRERVKRLTSDTVASSNKLIKEDATPDDLVSVVAATSAVINAASSAGGEVDQELVDQAEEMVTKAVKTGIKSFAPDLDVEDPEQVANLLATNPGALEFAVEASIAIKSNQKSSDEDINEELNNRGLADSVSEGLKSVIAEVNNPDGITIGGSSASEALLNALVQFLTGGGDVSQLQSPDGRQTMALASSDIELDVDQLTGTVLISTPTEKYKAAVLNTRIVSASIPEGLTFLRDGRLMIVNDGVGIELAPVALDIVGFTAAIDQEGYSLTMKNDGSMEITLSDTDRFHGAFAFDNVLDAGESCDEVSIVGPEGALNDPAYAFGVRCADSVTQKIVPYVHASSFFRSIAGQGFTLTLDRNTGVMTIPDVGRFKAGYFVSDLSISESEFYEASKDTHGVAFRFTDLSGNGVEDDVLFYTENGVQAIFRLND